MKRTIVEKKRKNYSQPELKHNHLFGIVWIKAKKKEKKNRKIS